MQTATPESVGIKSENILRYVNLLEKSNLCNHALIIMRHGKIVFEKYWKPFNCDFLHRMYSVTKSFVAIGVGFLEQDGLVDLDAPIADYFPEEAEFMKEPWHKKQTVKQMLLMSTAKSAENWFAKRCDDRVIDYFQNKNKYSRPAGALFEYDSNGSFVLCALIERLTKKDFMTYMREKVLDEIGFSKEAYCLKCPGGHSWGDSALICTSRDLLKFAQFLMNYGCWNGKQLLNREFVRTATSKIIDNTMFGNTVHSAFGYGYQIWRTYDNSFFLNGMGCQLAVCSPDSDTVLIYNGDNQGFAEVAKEKIIEEFFKLIVRPIKEDSICENEKAHKELLTATENLELFSVKSCGSGIIEKINNAWYELSENPFNISKLQFSFVDDKCNFNYVKDGEEKQIVFGVNHNEFSYFPENNYPDEIGSVAGNRQFKCAASLGVMNDYQMFMKVQIIDTYFGNIGIGVGVVGDDIAIRMVKVAEDFLYNYEGFVGGTKIKD